MLYGAFIEAISMEKTVLITGCSSGIGKETALYFAQNDWNVVATIYKAATDQSWKLRYKTGKYAGTILAFRRLLPYSLFFSVVRRLTLK